MLKLVTQFDNKESKVSLATPTCGCGSCCCCCCLISTIIVPAVTARSFPGVWATDEEETTKLYPEGISKENIHLTEVKKDKLARVFFMLLLLLSAVAIASILLILSAGSLNDIGFSLGLFFVFCVSAGLYWIIFSRLRRRGYSANHIGVRNVIALLILAALVIAEFFAALYLLLDMPILYLILIIAAAVSATIIMVRK